MGALRKNRFGGPLNLSSSVILRSQPLLGMVTGCYLKGGLHQCLLGKEDINLSLKILTVPQAEHHRDHQENKACAREDKTKTPAWFWLGQVLSFPGGCFCAANYTE